MAELKKAHPLESRILTIRGEKVLLDSDLAQIYGVSTKRLNEQVKRNAGRFPKGFIFQLTAGEVENLKSQIATSSLGTDIAHGGRRKLPNAFTEHGAIMAAMILNSPQAVAMSVFVVRAFLQMREQLAANAAILKRLAEIDKTLLEHDHTLRAIWAKLQPMLAPAPTPPRRRIGFNQDNE